MDESVEIEATPRNLATPYGHMNKPRPANVENITADAADISSDQDGGVDFIEQQDWPQEGEQSNNCMTENNLNRGSNEEYI